MTNKDEINSVTYVNVACLTGMALNGLVTDKPRSVCISLAD